MQAAAKGVPLLNSQAAQQTAGPGDGADGNRLAAPPTAAARMAAVDAGGGGGGGGGAGDRLSVAEVQHNLSTVQSMSEQDVRDAHDELKKLFSQSSLDFLASRKAAQGTQQQHQPAAAAPAAPDAPMPEPEPKPEPEPEPELQPQP